MISKETVQEVAKLDHQLEKKERREALELSPQKTEEHGDCAFHASLGNWSPSLKKFVCPNVANLRKQIADEIRSDTKSPANHAIMEAMQQMIIAERQGGKAFRLAREQFKKFLASHEKEICEAWEEFEKELMAYPDIIKFIDEHVPLGRDLRNKLFICLQKDDNELYAMILSLEDLHKKYKTYTEKTTQGFNWETLLQDKELREEYAELMGRAANEKKDGYWLLPGELEIIAIVLNITIELYIDDGKTKKRRILETYNPQGTKKVSVYFNGRNHYERMARRPKSELDEQLTEEELLAKRRLSASGELVSLSSKSAFVIKTKVPAASFSAFSTALLRDEPSERLRAKLEALSGSKREAGTVPVYGLGEKRYMSLALAREILSQNTHGQDTKTNRMGSNLVTHKDGVFYKRLLTGGPSSCPLVEQAVYQISRQLGTDIVTPTELLFIETPEGIFTVQASLEVPGINLEEFLHIPEAITGLKEKLGEEFPKIFTSLLEGAYYQTWLTMQAPKHAYSMDVSWKEQLNLFVEAIYKLKKAHWPLDFYSKKKEIILADLEQEKALYGKDLRPLLAAIECFPELAASLHLPDLYRLLKVFEDLKILYPNYTTDATIKAAEELWRQFEVENFSQHLILALLTEPQDHKGDNFIVRVAHDSNGHLLPLKIIAIDNDLALEGVFSGKTGNHGIKARSMIYALCCFLKMPFAKKLRDHLLSLEPERMVLQWLGCLAYRHQQYQGWVAQGALPPHLFEELELNKQIPVGFIERLIARIKTIQSYLQGSLFTCEGLFSAIEPLLYGSYQKIYEHQKSPQRIIMALYGEKRLSVETLLADCLEQRINRKTIQSLVDALNTIDTQVDHEPYLVALNRLLSKSIMLTAEDRDVTQSLLLLSVLTRLVQVNFSRAELTLPCEALIAVYEQEPLGLIQFLKQCTRVWITLKDGGEKLLFTDKDNFYRFMQVAHHGSRLLEILMDYGLSPNIIRAIDGYSPLHFAASFYPHCVLPLIQGGANLEAFNIEGRTALDLAILHQKIVAIDYLISAGAGRNLHLKNCLSMLSLYGETHPALCKQLLAQSLELAWKFSLERITQSAATKEMAYLELEQEKRYLRSDVYRQLFGCNLYIWPKIEINQIPARRNAVILVKSVETSKPGYQVYFVKNREWLWEKPQVLKSIFLKASFEPSLIEILRRADKTGLIKITDKNLNTIKKVLDEILKHAGLVKEFEEGFPKDNPYGQRPVTSIECSIGPHISVGLHFKENPELAIREMMVHLLAKKLFGFITPSVAVFKMAKEMGWLWQTTKFSYPILVSQTIEGYDLRDVLIERPEWLNHLDEQSVAEAIILAMLINPEDGRADNYKVQPYKHGGEIRYRLISIDNDHAFVRPLALDKLGVPLKGSKTLQVKTILFCLEQMNTPIAENVRNRLLTINPCTLLMGWLEALKEEQDKIIKLFDTSERRKLGDHNTRLELTFYPSMIFDVYQKLYRLKNVLTKEPIITYLELLSHVVPEIGLRYGEAFHRYRGVKERFDFLTEGCFAKKLIARKIPLVPTLAVKPITSLAKPIVIAANSTAKGKKEEYTISSSDACDIIRMSRDPQNPEQELPIPKLLDELEKVHEKLSELSAIREELQNGNTERFKKLPLVDYQEMVFNGKGAEFPGIDFAAMRTKEGAIDVRCQERVWQAIQGLPFRKLRIINYAALTDAQLNKCLLSMPLLQVLEIFGTSQLSYLNTPLPGLRKLKVREALRLKKWSHQGIRLEQIEFIDCRELSEIQVENSLAIRELRLGRCSVRHNVYYEKYPNLLQIDFSGISDQEMQTLNKKLIKLLENGLQSIPVHVVDTLTKMFHFRKQCLKALLPHLQDKDSYVRIRAAEALTKLSSNPETGMKTVEALLPLLQSENPKVRIITAEILAKLPSNPETVMKTVEALLLLLQNEDWYVRENAVETLTKLPHTEKTVMKTVEALLPLLQNEGLYDRISTVETLTKLPHTEKTVMKTVEALLLLLQNEDWYVRIITVETLTKLPHTEKTVMKTVEALLPLLQSENSDVRISTVETLAELPHTPETVMKAVEALLPLLQSENSDVRISTAKTLTKLSPTSETGMKTVEALLPLLQNAGPYVRITAAKTLTKLPYIPETTKTVMEALLPLLQSEDIPVRISTVETLAKLPHTPETVMKTVEALLPLLQSENPKVRIITAKTLAKLPHTPETVMKTVEALLPLLQSENPKVRIITAETLAKLPSNPETVMKAVEALLPLLKSEDLYVRISTAKTLVKLPHTEKTVMKAVEALLPLLQNEDWYVRRSTVEALAKLSPNPETVMKAVEALLPLLKSKDIHARISTVETLAELPHTPETVMKTVEALLPLLQSKDIHVHRNTAEILAKLSPNPETVMKAVEALLPLLKSKDIHARISTAKTLVKLPHTEKTVMKAVETLLPLLQNEDWYVRRSTVEALAKLPHTPETAKVVLDSLLQILKREKPSFKIDSLEIHYFIDSLEIHYFTEIFTQWLESIYQKISEDPNIEKNQHPLQAIVYDSQGLKKTHMLPQFALAIAQGSGMNSKSSTQALSINEALLSYDYTNQDIVNLLKVCLGDEWTQVNIAPAELSAPIYYTLFRSKHPINGNEQIIMPPVMRLLGRDLTQSLIDMWINAQHHIGKAKEILIPFNPGAHWVVLHVNLEVRTIIYLDSLRHEEATSFEEIVSNRIKKFGEFLSNLVKGEEFKIHIVTARLQPDDHACGMIVVDNIIDIINRRPLPNKLFSLEDVLQRRLEHRKMLHNHGLKLENLQDTAIFQPLLSSSAEPSTETHPTLLLSAQTRNSSSAITNPKTVVASTTASVARTVDEKENPNTAKIGL